MCHDITVDQLQDHVRALRRHFERDLARAEQRLVDASRAHQVELDELREALILLRRKLQLQVEAASLRERRLQAEVARLSGHPAGRGALHATVAAVPEVSQ
jgi:hypothetical protein